ncbi:MAG: hypothetical protein HY923_09595 [Elusimicrobia bacterium]|nr:hypothetical protein [Elusimicrobiota bacterium]
MRALVLAALSLFVSSGAFAQKRGDIQRELVVSHNVAGVQDKDLLDGAKVFDMLIKNSRFKDLDENRKKLVRELADRYVAAVRAAVQKRRDSGAAGKKDMRIFSLTVEWVTGPSEAEINRVVGVAGALDPGTPDVGLAEQQYTQLLQSELAKIGLGGLTRIGPVETITPESAKLVSAGSVKLVQDEKTMDIDVGFEPDTAVLRPGMEQKLAAAFRQQAAKPGAGVTHADVEASCALYKLGATTDKNHFQDLAKARAKVLVGLLKSSFGDQITDDKLSVSIADGNPNYPGTSGPSPQDILAGCKGLKGTGAGGLPKGFSCSPTPHWEKGAENAFYSQYRYSRARLTTYHTETTEPKYEMIPGQSRALVVALGNMHYYNYKK